MFLNLLHKKWFQLLCACIILFVIVLLQKTSGSSKEERDWAKVRKGDFYVKANETGEVKAVHSVDVKAPMEWRMELQIIDMAPEGSIVEKGDFLVQLDISTLLQQLDPKKDELQIALSDKEKLLAEQEAKMEELQSNLETAKYSRDIAVLQKKLLKFEADVKRQDADLDYKKALVQLEEAKTTITSQKIIDKAKLGSVELRILKARNDIADLERKVDEMTLRAPMDGMVVYNEIGNWNARRKAAIGEKVRPGQAIVSIPNLTDMQVNLRVNEMDALALQIGQQAVVSLDAYPDKKFAGKVTEIARLAEKQNENSRVKDFEVIVHLAATDTLLKPGMTAKAELTVAHLKSTLQIPIGAVYEKDGKPIVFPKNDFPRPVEIETGERDDQFVVINSGQIKEGDVLAYRAPDLACNRIGYADYVYAHQHENDLLKAAFAEMEKRDIKYDYDANRNKRVIAQADSNASPIDVEKLRQQFRALGEKGKAGELDPATMKKLQQDLKGSSTSDQNKAVKKAGNAQKDAEKTSALDSTKAKTPDDQSRNKK